MYPVIQVYVFIMMNAGITFSLSSSSVFVFRHGRGRMVAGFTTTYAIGTYNH
jgi:hypothetical protein